MNDYRLLHDQTRDIYSFRTYAEATQTRTLLTAHLKPEYQVSDVQYQQSPVDNREWQLIVTLR